MWNEPVHQRHGDGLQCKTKADTDLDLDSNFVHSFFQLLILTSVNPILVWTAQIVRTSFRATPAPAPKDLEAPIAAVNLLLCPFMIQVFWFKFSPQLCQWRTFVAVTGVMPCTSNPCQNGGTCVDLDDSFSCTCRGGFGGTVCSSEFYSHRFSVLARLWIPWRLDFLYFFDFSCQFL